MSIISDNQHQKHIEEAMSLEPMGYRQLIVIRLMHEDAFGDEIYLTSRQKTTWQGKTFESFPVGITGYSRSADEEASRPKFSLANPAGMFSKYARTKYLDNALISRYSVLTAHVAQDVNSFAKQMWRVARVMSDTPEFLVCELRGATDGQSFIIPPGQFLPPEFAQVSI